MLTERRIVVGIWIGIASLYGVILLMALGTAGGFCEAPLVADPAARWSTTVCAEYWLDRYQTLIGAIVAIVAGLLAWSAVRQQTIQNWRGIQVQMAQTRRSHIASMQGNIFGVQLRGNEICSELKAICDMLELICSAMQIEQFRNFNLTAFFSTVILKQSDFQGEYITKNMNRHVKNAMIGFCIGNNTTILKYDQEFISVGFEISKSEFPTADDPSALREKQWIQDRVTSLSKAAAEFEVNRRKLKETCDANVNGLERELDELPDVDFS